MFEIALSLLAAVSQVDALIGEGNKLQERSQFADAEKVYLQAISLSRGWGERIYIDALVHHNLATARYRLGHYADARSAYLKAIEEWRALRRDAELASSLSNFAELCHASGNDREALEYSSQSLALRKQIGKESINGLSTHANILRGLSRYTEARDILHRALKLAAVQDPGGPRHAFALSSLGQVSISLGNFDEARHLLEQSAEIWSRLHGKDSISYANTIAIIARIARLQGDLREAELHLRTALAIFERSLGSVHPRLVPALADLAEMVGQRGRNTDAIQLLLRAKTVAQTTLSENHPDFAALLLTIADQYRVAKQYSEAESAYRLAIERCEAIYGQTHPRLAAYLNNYATLLVEMGNRAAAEKFYRRALSIRESALGPMHIDNAETLLNLAVLLTDVSRFDQARPLIEQSLAIRQQSYGITHPSLLPSLKIYIHILQRSGEKKHAKEITQLAESISASQPAMRNTVDVRSLRTFR